MALLYNKYMAKDKKPFFCSPLLNVQYTWVSWAPGVSALLRIELQLSSSLAASQQPDFSADAC